jgi:hypothetical protein
MRWFRSVTTSASVRGATSRTPGSAAAPAAIPAVRPRRRSACDPFQAKASLGLLRERHADRSGRDDRSLAPSIITHIRTRSATLLTNAGQVSATTTDWATATSRSPFPDDALDFTKWMAWFLTLRGRHRYHSLIRLVSLVPLVPLLCMGAAVSGCLGGGNRYGKYQNQRSAIKQVDRLLAEIPQIAGARVTKRSEQYTVYKVGPDRYINAEPYSTTFSYTTPPGVTGERIQKHFRDVLLSRSWRCRFRPAEFTFGCTRGLAVIEGVIGTRMIGNRSQYELSLSASMVRPPIRVVQGD